MKARHAALSFTTSCQLVSFVKSLLTTSTHLSGAPPGGLFFPRGRHFISCFWGRSSDILCTWPNHCNRFCLNCSSIGNSPVSSRISVFRRLSHKVIPRISRRHLMWKVFSFLISCCVAGHVSAPYRRIDITRVRNARSLVVLLRLRLRNTFHLHIWYTVPAFFNLTVTSLSTLVV